jgi:hypothetical protein
MYQNGFVLAVRVGDRFVEEKNSNQFVVPFNTEYSLRLKNRNDRKAVARVYIDGEEVNKLGSFVLDPNSELDLERFVDKLDKGNKFKFVPLSDSRVKDKNDGENGFVEARFQLVKPVEKPIIYDHHYHHHHHHGPYYHWPYYGPYWNSGSSITLSGGTGGGTVSSNFTCNSMDSVMDAGDAEPLMASNCCSMDIGMEKGATIEGGLSGQKFSYSYVGELESTEVVLRGYLIGTSDPKIAEYYTKAHCTKCGKKYGATDKFCSGCGEAR